MIAAGGIGGNLDIVRREWPPELGQPPEEILMGSHYYADGAMHEEVTRIGGNVTHISSGCGTTPTRCAIRSRGGRCTALKLIPPRSGLVLDPTGRRYGPIPLMPTFDAYYALQRMCEDPRGYYWMICNWKIARRELDVSGSEHNPQIREKHLCPLPALGAARQADAGALLRRALPGLRHRPLTARAGAADAGGHRRRRARRGADGARGRAATTPRSRAARALFNDDQLRRIESLRNWRGDRLRTCKFQPIVDPKAMPLIAIRMTVMARKSLGGIQTDLRVTRPARRRRADPRPLRGRRGGRLRRRRHARQALARGHVPRRVRVQRPDRRARDRDRARPRRSAGSESRKLELSVIP